MVVTASPATIMPRCLFPLLLCTSLTTSEFTVFRQDEGDLVKSVTFTDSSDCDKIQAWFDQDSGGCHCPYGLTLSAETEFGCKPYKRRGTYTSIL